ncbi:MAG: cytochrome c oxidase assembly protein [Bacillota bacterium]|nr:cytochrome c oxidase assembly protein [Bacillota bacterium]
MFNTPLWLMWNWHPAVLVAVGLLAVGYPVLLRRTGTQGRGGSPWAFYGGLLLLLLSTESPIDHLGEIFLFWVHMVQHMLLTFTVPPLILLGLKGHLPDIPKPLLPVARFFTQPIVAALLFNGVFSAFHLPSLYEWAISNRFFHSIEHLALVGLAFLFWTPIIEPHRQLSHLSEPGKIVYVFLSGLLMIPVFAGVTFADVALYSSHADAPRIMRLTPLEDQQLGGIVMKLWGGLVYALVLVVAFYRWVAQDPAGKADPQLSVLPRREAPSREGA